MSSHILNNFFIRAYRDENVIDYVKNRVAAYEDSVLKYNEMDLNVNSISLGYWIKIIGNF